MKKYLLVMGLLILFLFGNGCATLVGFGIGQQQDHENETMDVVPLDQLDSLEEGDRILIKVDGERQRGVFERFEEDLLVMRVLTTQSGGVWDRIPVSDISKLYRFNRPNEATIRAVRTGIMVDVVVLLTVLLVRSWLNSIPGSW